METILKKQRVSKGMTQRDMAAKVGITETAYQRYEYGIRFPNARTAIRIAKALDSTVEKLWDGNPTEQATPLL